MGHPSLEPPGGHVKSPSWGLKLASMLMSNSTTIHEFFLAHLGTVFSNGGQAFLHWFIGEGMDGVRFPEVENDLMIWC